MNVSRSGGNNSEARVFGANPPLLFLKIELVIYSDPPELVPEYPRPLYSDTTLFTIASQG